MQRYNSLVFNYQITEIFNKPINTLKCVNNLYIYLNFCYAIKVR